MDTKKRTCLKCAKSFDSTGPGNRICPPCRRINDSIPISEGLLKKQRGNNRHNGELLAPQIEE